jgi:hypothetical protein
LAKRRRGRKHHGNGNDGRSSHGQCPRDAPMAPALNQLFGPAGSDLIRNQALQIYSMSVAF